MKREIKFRVWDNVLNIYHYNWQAVIHGHLQAKSYGDVDFTAIEDPELTFEQFTGCLDKNGVEIYEGDIVQRRRYRFEVEDCYNLTEDEEYEQITETSHIIYTGHGFQPATEKFGYEGEELWNWRTMKVIGNIHENK